MFASMGVTAIIFFHSSLTKNFLFQKNVYLVFCRIAKIDELCCKSNARNEKISLPLQKNMKYIGVAVRLLKN